MSRGHFWLCLCVCFGFAAPASSAESPKRLNVLMIAVDDLRPQLGCYGDRVVKSPNIDRLAARGLVFDRAYCQVALCSPSRIALLSGLRPDTTGIFEIGPTLRSRAPDVVTLPQLFKQNGYFARSLGKVYHVGIDDPESWSVPSWHSKKPRYGPEGQAKVSKAAAALKASGKTPPERGPELPFYAGPAFEAPEVDDDELLDGDTAREAVAALAELARKPETPFFLAVGFANPHVPWVAPKKYWDLYDPNKLTLPEFRDKPQDAPAFAAASGADFYWYGNVPKDRVITPEFGRQCLHGYLAAISYVDALVGRLLAALEENKLAENTIVIFWGDHGYYMGEHGWWGGKHNNYEGATRAPLLISVPGQKSAGKHTTALVEFMDIYPTLAELCGLKCSEQVAGVSFAPLVDDPTRPWKTMAISQYRKSKYLGTAIRTDRYRYVEWVDKEGNLGGVELYDYQTDPEERRNWAPTADRAMLEQLQKQLHAGWQASKPK